MAIYLGNTLLTGPSGGGGDAVLANDQTFTGRNTFSDTAIFSDTSSTEGSIQVRNIHGIGVSDTYLTIVDGFIVSTVKGTQIFDAFNNGTTAAFVVNSNAADVDFSVHKMTSGDVAVGFDAGTDTFTVGAGNIVGVADSETGTWTAVFTNAGTVSAPVASYSKSGDIVTLSFIATVSVGGTGLYGVTSASLPFPISNTNLQFYGGFQVGLIPPLIVGQVHLTSTGILFLKSDGSYMTGTEVSGLTSFTITYQTT